MKNVTISIGESLLALCKKRAAQKGVSLNALIKGLLQREVLADDADWIEEFFRKGDELGLRSVDGKPMRREEIYDREGVH